MKILCTTAALDLGPQGSLVRRHFLDMASAFERGGHDVSLLVARYGKSSPETTLPTVQLRTTSSKRLHSYLAAEFLRALVMPWVLVRTRPHLVYARKDVLDPAVAFWSWVFRVPLVVEVNGLVVEVAKRHGRRSRLLLWLYALAERFIYARASRIICVSEGIRRKIEQSYGLDPMRMAVTENGVDAERFRPLDRHASRLLLLPASVRDDFVVGFVGSFAPWHWVDGLLEAAVVLRDRGVNDLALVLVGSGPTESALCQRASDLGLSGITYFAGRVAPDDVPEYIASFDVGISPFAVSDLGSPLKVVEYMACGRAVIASHIDGVEDVIGAAGCGVTVPAGDVQALADAIEWARRNPDELDIMGGRGRAWAEQRYSWEAIAQSVVDIVASER